MPTPPKPTLLKAIAGNPGKRPLNTGEPVPTVPIGEPPEHLNDRQKEIWRLVIQNAPHGLLGRIDDAVLLAWVVARSIHEEATENVNKFGYLIKSPKQGIPMQNPYLAILNRQAVIMGKLAADLGFSPTARSKVKCAGDQSKPGNRFSKNGRRPHT